ncbi:MAG: DNA repair protein RadA [Vampirovibrionales bacterium]|nr:DNA repair protein RadA [Vampirovibrionales bacterium]
MATVTKTKKAKTHYECVACGYVAAANMGKCPNCQGWGTIEATTHVTEAAGNATQTLHHELLGLGTPPSVPLPLSQVVSESHNRQETGWPELDRVLGGGLMPGSYILLGGDPGIGKSTLMLQMALRLAQSKQWQHNAMQSGKSPTLLYVAGEESPAQIRQRAERLLPEGAALPDAITLTTQTALEPLLQIIHQQQPALVIVDSIQSLSSGDAASPPGSLSQIKACAAGLMPVAKGLGIPVILIGHVTKEGQLSGPKVLEHLVDTVLYVEGDRYRHLRLVRAVKNRFGNTQEVGVFEMEGDGLREVTNPSALFVSDAVAGQQSGSVITATLEGTRPLLVEIQALVGTSSYSVPRRLATGVDLNRLHKLIAVLERRLGLDLSRQDVYLNVVGGLSLDDPATELAMAVAIVSSLRDRPVNAGTVILGEVGLTGEVRPIRQLPLRLKEVSQLGFAKAVVPKSVSPKKGTADISSIQCAEVDTLLAALPLCFSSAHKSTDL